MKPVTFDPICPFCGTKMETVKGQALGALHCPNCKGEFWDEIEMTDLRPIDGPELICPRCKLPMKKFKDNAWFCNKCDSQFWLDSVPNVEAVIDQMIKCNTAHLRKPNMKAKIKSHGSNSGRRRREKPKFETDYRIF